MTLFKRDWTPVEAEEWTHHDFWASVFSILSYFLVTIGIAGALLLQVWGFVTLALGVASALIMFRVIDPKLKAISGDFEAKEAQYLADLDRVTRWEASDER
jgi:small-conductance mechanosensitive channel